MRVTGECEPNMDSIRTSRPGFDRTGVSGTVSVSAGSRADVDAAAVAAAAAALSDSDDDPRERPRGGVVYFGGVALLVLLSERWRIESV